jgi:hypothetical protein
MTNFLDKERFQLLQQEIVYDLEIKAWKYGNDAERTFVVSATGKLPSPAWDIKFRKAIPQGFNPSQLLLHLDVIFSGVPAPQVIIPFSLSYTETAGESGIDYSSTLVLAPGQNHIQAEFDESFVNSDAISASALFVSVRHPNELQQYTNISLDTSGDIGQASLELAGGGAIVGEIETEWGSGIIVKTTRDNEDAGGFVSFISDRSTYRKKLVRGLTWYTPGWPPTQHRGDLWLRVTHPRVSEITDDIDTCVAAGAVTATLAGIAAIIFGGGGSVPVAVTAAFKAALITCLTAKGIEWASDLSIRLYLD